MYRLSQALKQHNWFAVIVELLTIVIGIFIALQVDAWNNARLKQQDVEFQLTRIREDANSIYAQLDEEIDIAYRQLEHIGITMGVLDGLPLTKENKAQFMEGIQASYQQRGVDIDIPGLQLLYDSGDIDLVSDERVRNALITHLSRRRVANDIFAHQRKLWDMNLERVFVGLAFSFAEFDRDARSVRVLLDVDVDQLRSDVEFRRALSRVARMQNHTLAGLRSARESIGQVIAALDN